MNFIHEKKGLVVTTISFENIVAYRLSLYYPDETKYNLLTYLLTYLHILSRQKGDGRCLSIYFID
jgi:hypothetical protein